MPSYSSPITVRLPGRRTEKLGVINVANEFPGAYKRTPEWMVSFSSLNIAMLAGTIALKTGIGNLNVPFLSSDPIKAKSTADKLKTFTELFGWNAEMYRFTDGHESGALASSAGVQHTPLVLMVSSGYFAAHAENILFNGTLVDSITIVRLGFVKSQLQILQTLVFQKCRMTRFQQQLDRLIMHFSIQQKEMAMTVFNQDGSPRGMAVGQTNIRENTAYGLGLETPSLKLF